MSTQAEVFEALLHPSEVLERVERRRCEDLQDRSSLDHLVESQLRSLVRRVFFPGWPRPAHQVVLSAVDDSETGTTALKIGEAMAREIPGNIGLVEIQRIGLPEETPFGRKTPEQVGTDQRPAVLRMSSRQILSKLWLIPYTAFCAGHRNGLSASWLRGRLSELRLDFDYLLINAASVNRSSEPALLGSLTDGVILTIAANATRRLVARKCTSALRDANARVLGTILTDRVFPIPEKLYRKL